MATPETVPPAPDPAAPPPETSAAIQTPPAAAPTEGSVPLPPPAAPEPISPERLLLPPGRDACSRPGALERGSRLDTLLVAIVLVLAFLLAFFPVRNADFFRQAAVGRLVANGQYAFGSNPFTLPADATWINHSWLFGLLVYALYQLPSSGIVLVVLKGLLATAVAALMLRLGRRPGESLWVPAVCTILAVVALSPGLELQPALLSCFLLGLTLWLLHRPALLLEAQPAPLTEADGAVRPALVNYRSLWFVPIVCLFWVNLDSWFLLGPLAVALYLLGRAVQPYLNAEAPPQPGELRTLGLVLLVSLLACLVNPYWPQPWRVFALPPELGLSGTARLLRDDPQFQQAFLSPLRSAYLTESGAGLNPAGVAHVLLLLAGLVSFAMTWPTVRGWRLLSWVGFALLSVASVRAIPFFAVLAGPITALNFLDAARRLGWMRPPQGSVWEWGHLGRMLTLLGGLLLLVAAVPGWLEARPLERRVGWGVEPNPAFQRAAQHIHAWRQDGLLPADTVWFNTTTEAANYLAWYCPGERAFFDQDLPAFPEIAQEYLDAREALEGQNTRAEGSAAERMRRSIESDKVWQRIFQERGVRFVLYDHSARGVGEHLLFLRLFAGIDTWALCHLEGQAAIFGWRRPDAEGKPSPAEADLLKPLVLNVRLLAFGPDAAQAPPDGSRPPELTPWWQQLWRRQPSDHLDSNTALLHDTRFSALEPRYQNRNGAIFRLALASSAVGSGAGPGPLNTGTLLTLRAAYTYKDFPVVSQTPRGPTPLDDLLLQMRGIAVNDYAGNVEDAGPVDSLYLAIRAGRRALAINPDDPSVYHVLGRSYLRLGWMTGERALGANMPDRRAIRTAQMASSFVRLLRLQPDRGMALEAHKSLSDLFSELRYFDLATQHRREWLRYRREQGRSADETEEAYERQMDELTRRVDAMEDELRTRRDRYEVQSANKPVLQKVQIALELGLVEQAIDTLTKADAADLAGRGGKGDPAQGARLAVELLMSTGRLEEAGQILYPEKETGEERSLLPKFAWVQVRLAVAEGDYANADRFLAELQANGSPNAPPLAQRAAQTSVWLGEILLREAPRATGMPWYAWPHFTADWRPLLSQATQTGLSALQDEADLRLLRGWIALEAGRTTEAREHFHAVVDLTVPRERWLPVLEKLTRYSPQEVQGIFSLASRQVTTVSLARHYLRWLEREK